MSAREAAPALRRFRVTPPVPFRLAHIVRSHGWVELAPWRWDGTVLARRERIDGVVGEWGVRQAGDDGVVTWRAGRAAPRTKARLPPVSKAAILAVVGRALSWDWDHGAFCALAAGFEPAAAALVADGGGRMLRGSSFYEDFVKTVCTINTSWAGTCKMTENLTARVGHGLFPTPRQILRFGEARLREDCRMGFRAPVLIGCTERLLDDGAIDAAGHGTGAALGYEYLLALKGIGPYAAAHCRVLLHDFSRLPVDSVVTAHLRDTLGITDADAVEAHFAPWGDYRFLGYRLRRNEARRAAGEFDDGW
jgi:3-methyladenine DNA glycosylase/8-oxoguanine DNA glycosylase